MNLTEIGAALREARERKGLSIEAVEEQIKISRSILVALEEGTSSKFPHPVYARGFVRSYATLLGLDQQDLTAHFCREYPVPPDTDHPHDYSGPQITVRYNDSTRQSLALWITVILAVVALGLVGWYAYRTYWDRQVETSASTSELADASVTEVGPVAVLSTIEDAPLTQMQEMSEDVVAASGAIEVESNGNSSTDSAASNASVTSTGADNATNATSPVSKIKAPDTQTQGTVTANTSVAPPANASTQLPSGQQKPQKADQTGAMAEPAGMRVLAISAHAASWLQARADDNVTDFFLRKGESTKVAFTKSLTLKLGNAGGVTLTLDGQPYPLDAQSGEVKTLVFN